MKQDLRNIPIEMLIRLADYYDTTIDYLVGRTDNEEPYQNDAESESVPLTRFLSSHSAIFEIFASSYSLKIEFCSRIKSVRIYRTLIPGFTVKIIRNIICYKLTSMACIDFILCKFQLI